MSADQTPPPDDRRMLVFAALVNAQDSGVSVRESREEVAQQFRLPVEEVVAIEREGLSRQWPPLEPAARP